MSLRRTTLYRLIRNVPSAGSSRTRTSTTADVISSSPPDAILSSASRPRTNDSKSVLVLLLMATIGVFLFACKNDVTPPDDDEPRIWPGQVKISFEDNIDYDKAKSLLQSLDYLILGLDFWYIIYVETGLKDTLISSLKSDPNVLSTKLEYDTIINNKQISVINFLTKGVSSFDHFNNLAIKYSVIPFKYAWWGRATIKVEVGDEYNQAEIIEKYEWCRYANVVLMGFWTE